MTSYLYEFIGKCDRAGITPDEKHIDAFLNQYNKFSLRENFIKFCFYNWEDRKNELKMDKILNIF
jgi:hypothetical protein